MPDFPSRGDIQLELHGNIAGSSAGRIIVRCRCHCRLPTTTPACMPPIVFIIGRNGLKTAIGGERWAFLPKLVSGPLPRGVVLMDAGYGNNNDLRTEITALGLTYVAGLPVEHNAMGAPHRSLAAEAMVGPRPYTETDAPQPSASASRRQGARDRPAGQSLAHHHVTSRSARVWVRAAHREQRLPTVKWAACDSAPVKTKRVA